MKSSVAHQFSRAASSYSNEDALQTRLRHALFERVLCAAIDSNEQVQLLDVGSGTGALSRLLAMRFPMAKITAIDIAPRMVQLAVEQSSEFSTIAWECCDFFDFPATSSYRAVVSNASFQWIRPLPEAFARVRSLLDSDGRFICSLIVDGSLAEVLAARSAVSPGKPLVVRLPTAKEVCAALASSGFAIATAELRVYRLTFSSVAQVLRHLKCTGVTGATENNAASRLTVGECRSLERHYPHTDSAAVTLSYRTLLVDAYRM